VNNRRSEAKLDHDWCNGLDETVLDSVSIDHAQTRNSLQENGRRISWSKLQQYERCPGNWLVENHAVFVNRADHTDDSLHAMPGTLVQRVWEAIINERIYRRDGLNESSALAAWAGRQIAALFDCIARPLAEQHRLGKDQWRGYFNTDAAKAELVALAEAHGLDPSLRYHLQPKFVRFEQLFKLHGGRDEFFAKLTRTFLPTLGAFNSAGLDLDGMLAETFVEARNGDNVLAGGIDFLWNRTRSAAGYFDDIATLADGYVMLDGKFQLGPTVDIGQLRFYATMLLLTYGKRPSRLGFLSYTAEVDPVRETVWRLG